MDEVSVNAEIVRNLIEKLVISSSDNVLGGPFGHEPAWGKPLVGFCRGDDQIFEVFRDVAGEEHWTPLEIFSITFRDLDVKAQDLSVVSWVLPQTEKTREDQGKEKSFPCERWVRSRIFGEEFNDLVRCQVVQRLDEMGFHGVAPVISSQWSRIESDRYIYSSRWSERHVAHACGLGTFGLCDGLITSLGKAVRFGSVVVDMPLPVVSRIFESYYDHCPFLKAGKCGACIARCPAGAISEIGHDKKRCSDYIQDHVAPYVREKWGLEGRAGCGLCQVGIPCESCIPDVEQG